MSYEDSLMRYAVSEVKTKALGAMRKALKEARLPYAKTAQQRAAKLVQPFFDEFPTLVGMRWTLEDDCYNDEFYYFGASGAEVLVSGHSGFDFAYEVEGFDADRFDDMWYQIKTQEFVDSPDCEYWERRPVHPVEESSNFWVVVVGPAEITVTKNEDGNLDVQISSW